MNDNRVQIYGATMYVPANNHALHEVRNGSIKGLGSMVICLEDSIRDDEVDDALLTLRNHLAANQTVPDAAPHAYARPRDPDMAERIMRMEGSRALRGFVIPKATPDTLHDWMSILRGERWAIMPTIETIHAFDPREVARLRDQASTIGIPVDTVRIGGNDILSTIGARRSCHRTLYDGPLGPVVSTIVGMFAGTGIPVSSPVLEHYADERLLIEEIERDLEHGIHSKTVIHPRQVRIVNDAMRPTMTEISEARSILDENAAAVFGRDGSMCEPKTHAPWALNVLDRQRFLGARPSPIATTAIS